MSTLRIPSILGLALLAATTLSAKPAFLKAAKDAKIEGVATCMSCHTNTAPGKVAFTPRGTFLKDRKLKDKAKDVDVNWLKDFKG